MLMSRKEKCRWTLYNIQLDSKALRTQTNEIKNMLVKFSFFFVCVKFRGFILFYILFILFYFILFLGGGGGSCHFYVELFLSYYLGVFCFVTQRDAS